VGPHLWPLFDLRVRTPRLELRPATDDDLVRLFELAREGVHPPDEMPFAVPWTDALHEPDAGARFLQFHWGVRSAISPERWSIEFAVVVDGELAGSQSLRAERFAALRTVDTGSWLARRAQGRGTGTEMRAAALHLAFAGLGALVAESGALVTNASSARVSEKLGYVDNGLAFLAPRGTPVLERRFRLDRDRWAERRREDIEIVGLEPCLAPLGAVEEPPEPVGGLG
jgi:RimJ/RimL family protein N-acetyltransferase